MCGCECERKCEPFAPGSPGPAARRGHGTRGEAASLRGARLPFLPVLWLGQFRSEKKRSWPRARSPRGRTPTEAVSGHSPQVPRPGPRACRQLGVDSRDHGPWQAGAAPPPRRAQVRFPKEISTFRLCPQTTTVTATTVPLKAGSHLRSGLPSPNTLVFHQDLIPTLRSPCVSLAGDLSGGTLGGFTLLLLKSLQ